MIKKRILIFLLFFYFVSVKSQVNFSHDAGVYNTPFYLKIAYPDEATLYYHDIHVDQRKKIFSDSLLINRTTTIFFELNNDGELINLYNKTYFLDFQTNFNIVSLTIPNNSLFNRTSGIYVDGPNAYYDSTISKINGCVSMSNSNYLKKIEREVYVEVFDESGLRIINQSAGLRIFGGLTRYYPEKSLKIVARKKYGKSRMKANIFKKGIKKYKQFVLRHSGQDYKKTRFKDVLSTNLASKSFVDVQASVPSHLFVNTEYWGVYNIREKINKHYINNNYGVDEIDLLKGKNTVEEGNSKRYKELLNFFSNSNLSLASEYNHAISLMDHRNFANFWIYQIYFGNQDVRGNIRYWRSDSLDGRFRWILYDTDLGWFNSSSSLLFDIIFTNNIKWYNPKWSTFLLRSLLVNKEFKEYFINQITFLTSTILSEDYVKKEIEELENKYKPEMIRHFEDRKKFQNYQGSFNTWQKEVNKLKTFASERSEILFYQTQKAFELPSHYNLKINIENKEKGKVLLNYNELKSNKFNGRFFSSLDVPIEIISELGYTYVGWDSKVIKGHNNKDILINISFIKNKESQQKIIINEINYKNFCFEIFNQDSTIVNLNGWKIMDNDKNIHTIENCMLEKGRFAVFHFNNFDNMIDTVIYNKIDFKFSSKNKLIALYDNKGRLVDSVRCDFKSSKNTYSRNIPFNNFYGTQVLWDNIDSSTIGWHNHQYTKLLDRPSWRLMLDWISSFLDKSIKKD